MVAIKRHSAPLSRTSGRGNTRKYITIHETANRGRGADANAHARLQAAGNSRNASWHYQVDDKQIIQSYDDDVRCWHAGATANNQSIAIEICVNSDGNYQKALDNAAALVAHLRKKHGIPWNRVVSHKFWTGKNCPTIMLSRKGQWDKFIKATDPKGSNKVSTTESTTKPAAKPKPASKPAPVKTGEWPTNALIVDGKYQSLTKRGYQRLLAPKNVGNYQGRIDAVMGALTTKAEQTWLKRLGFYRGLIDGQRGPVTIKALQRFLRSKRFYSGLIDGKFQVLSIKGLQQYLNSQRKFYK